MMICEALSIIDAGELVRQAIFSESKGSDIKNGNVVSTNFFRVMVSGM